MQRMFLYRWCSCYYYCHLHFSTFYQLTTPWLMLLAQNLSPHLQQLEDPHWCHQQHCAPQSKTRGRMRPDPTRLSAVGKKPRDSLPSRSCKETMLRLLAKNTVHIILCATTGLSSVTQTSSRIDASSLQTESPQKRPHQHCPLSRPETTQEVLWTSLRMRREVHTLAKQSPALRTRTQNAEASKSVTARQFEALPRVPFWHRTFQNRGTVDDRAFCKPTFLCRRSLR